MATSWGSLVQINLLEIPSSSTSFGLISLSIGFKTDDCSRVVASLCPLWPKEGGGYLTFWEFGWSSGSSIDGVHRWAGIQRQLRAWRGDRFVFFSFRLGKSGIVSFLIIDDNYTNWTESRSSSTPHQEHPTLYSGAHALISIPSLHRTKAISSHWAEGE